MSYEIASSIAYMLSQTGKQAAYSPPPPARKEGPVGIYFNTAHAHTNGTVNKPAGGTVVSTVRVDRSMPVLYLPYYPFFYNGWFGISFSKALCIVNCYQYHTGMVSFFIQSIAIA